MLNFFNFIHFVCSITKIGWLWSESTFPRLHRGSLSTRKIRTARRLFSSTSFTNRGSLPTHTPKTEIKNRPQGTISYFWWLWSESNRHSFRNLILSQARLPVPPQSQKSTVAYFAAAFFASTFFTKRALRVGL